VFGFLLMLWPTAAHTEGGMPLWINRYDGPANSEDVIAAIAVDSSGNVFVTGYSDSGASHFDYTTIKYSSAGVPLWTNRYDDPGGLYDWASAIAVDSAGNVFVTGAAEGFGTGLDYATIKYSNAGVPLWTNRYDGPGSLDDSASAIAVDRSGNVFVTGNSESIGTGRDYATIKYSNTGVPLWTNRYDRGGGSYDFPRAVAVDSLGDVFVTGNSASPPSDAEINTIKYSSAGMPLWTNRYVGGAPVAMVVDASNNAFVAGIGGGNHSFATFKYSNAGALLWTRLYKGPANYEDTARAIAVDSGGNVFVTGESFSGVLGNDTNPANADFATIKYSSAGVPLWTRRYNGPANKHDGAFAIASDSNGNVFVTGYSSNGTNNDFVTMAYSNDGMPLWTNRYNGAEAGSIGPGIGPLIAVDVSGTVFVAGTSGYGINSDYVTFKYSSSILPARLNSQKLNNQLVLSWTNAGFNLQTAPFVTGPFTNLPAATSPYTNPLTAPQQFFRLKLN
jgi:hypothetical protein